MAGGRPKKPAVCAEKYVAITDASSDRLGYLSARIAEHLNIAPGLLSNQLAEVVINYELDAAIQKNGTLVVKRQGRRPYIQYASLLVACARINENHTGENATDALKKIGGWSEDAEVIPPIVAYANAVLGALGITRYQSWRTQIRRALELV